MIINMASNREFLSAGIGCGVIRSDDFGMLEKIITGIALFISFRISFLHLSPIPF